MMTDQEMKDLASRMNWFQLKLLIWIATTRLCYLKVRMKIDTWLSL